MGMPAAPQGRATYHQPGQGWSGEEHSHPCFLRALDLGLVPRCPRGRGCHGATEQGRQGLPTFLTQPPGRCSRQKGPLSTPMAQGPCASPEGRGAGSSEGACPWLSCEQPCTPRPPAAVPLPDLLQDKHAASRDRSLGGRFGGDLPVVTSALCTGCSPGGTECGGAKTPAYKSTHKTTTLLVSEFFFNNNVPSSSHGITLQHEDEGEDETVC